MKKIFSLTAILLCALLLLPLTSLKLTENNIQTISPTETNTENKNTDSFRLCFSETKEVEEISAEDYIFGVVAAEMPALYEEEALKAQAIAAYTFALYRKEANVQNEYDLTDSHLTDQSFITLEEAKTRWGENADNYIKKIQDVISEVKGLALTYKNKPICAVYHAISFGVTEDAKNVWGSDHPYLKSVDSYGDKLSKDYISSLSLTTDEFKEKLNGKIEFTENTNEYIGKITRTDAGTVKNIKICNNEISGNTIRELLELKSANFEIKYNEGNFIFTVYGYGHSVGLSQNGANYMAKQGAEYKEILNHYYKDCKIEKIK